MANIRRLLALARRGLVFSGDTPKQTASDMRRIASLNGWPRLRLLLDILNRLAGERRPRLLASAGFSSELDERDGKRLTAVCEYVNRFYEEGIQQKKAASMAGLSPAAFSRFFHKRMGKTFEAYVAEVRVGHACRRLMDGDSTIFEIASSTGFNNLSNSNRHFRKLKGVPPRDFRRSFRTRMQELPAIGPRGCDPTL
ncbi:MAG: AraC family transcriptional regulator [Terrimicrobiaceae bacterium]|nr:AraC family transcriptional regulator [Terrimicrobiaceae bacterium]